MEETQEILIPPEKREQIIKDVRVKDDVYMYIYTVYFYLRKNTTKNATRFGNKLSNKTS